MRCNCGGAVELDDSSYTEETLLEFYTCASCGQSGTLKILHGTELKSGCLE